MNHSDEICITLRFLPGIGVTWEYRQNDSLFRVHVLPSGHWVVNQDDMPHNPLLPAEMWPRMVRDINEFRALLLGKPAVTAIEETA